MQQYASGPVASLGLVGSDGPPLSPETVGRAPSGYEASAVPLRSFELMLADRAGAEGTADPVEELDPTEELPPAAGPRRLVVRLLGGEELELGSYDDRDGALAAAHEVVARFTAAETAGEWPELQGRLLRPGAIASVDILVAG
jgi:hypothetical protein